MSGSGISWAICKSAPRSRQITTPVPHAPSSVEHYSDDVSSTIYCSLFSSAVKLHVLPVRSSAASSRSPDSRGLTAAASSLIRTTGC